MRPRSTTATLDPHRLTPPASGPAAGALRGPGGLGAPGRRPSWPSRPSRPSRPQRLGRRAGRLWGLVALLAGLGATAAAPASAADACPLIRPADLNPSQVDAMVLDRVAVALQRPATQVRLDASLQAQMPPQSGSDAAALYGFAAMAIGEALGFDAAPRFAAAAQALGAAPPQSALNVATLQAISRRAYQEGSDGPPPLADAQRVYALGGLQVRPPQAAQGWYLMRCGHDQISFWRRGVADNEVATAVARITGLPAWRGTDAFVDDLREVLMGSVPAGYRVLTLQVHALMGTPQPCVAANLLARAGDAPFRLRARFCYASTQARHGPTVLFSHAGSDDVLQFRREADQFIDRAFGLTPSP